MHLICSVTLVILFAQKYVHVLAQIFLVLSQLNKTKHIHVIYYYKASIRMNLFASWIINSFAIIDPSRVIKKIVHHYGFVIFMWMHPKHWIKNKKIKYMHIVCIFVIFFCILVYYTITLSISWFIKGKCITIFVGYSWAHLICSTILMIFICTKIFAYYFDILLLF